MKPISATQQVGAVPSSSSGVAEGRFSTFVDGTPIVKTEAGLVAIGAPNGKIKAMLASLNVGDVIEVRGRSSEIPQTSPNAYSGPMVEAVSIKVKSRAPVAEGRFSVNTDGTPLVKTDEGAVLIVATGPEVKKQLATLRLGDTIQVFGKKTTLGPDAAVEATAVKLTARSELARVAGHVMHLSSMPGYPSGAFLKLDQPVNIGGKPFDLVRLPGSFSADIGGRYTLEGKLAVLSSPAGIDYAYFSEGPRRVLAPRPDEGDAFVR